MPRLIGTPGDDQLFAPDDDGWVIRGRRGDDYLEGGDGVDRLYGDAGNDQIQGWGGNDSLYGGSGDDLLSGGRDAWGGTGNDVIDAWELAVGGSGNDLIYGVYALHGDEGPGREHRVAGNDELHAVGVTPLTTMNGGLGADQFHMYGRFGDGAAQTFVIEDFEPGMDKIRASALDPQTGADTGSAALFAKLDANHNGVLEWSDSVGPDGDWTTLDGSPVYTDGHNMYIGLGFTFAGTSSNDAEDWLIVHGTNQITAADWIMT